MKSPQVHYCDILVIGGGLAGMQVALHAGAHRVILVDGGVVGKSGASPRAKGGVAVVVNDADAPHLHAADTEVAGAGICDPNIVRMVCEAGPARLAELLACGVPFDRGSLSELALSHEAAHSHRRVVRAGGDRTGQLICETLSEKLRAATNVELRERCRIVELIAQAGQVTGAWLQHPNGHHEAVLAHATVLATGGLGQLYARTSNPPEALGSGLSLAIRAGAELSDLEFVQFHPTGLWAGEASVGQPMPLISEAVRGEGALLVDAAGRRFMGEVHPAAELAPRDIVSRAIWRQQSKGKTVYLDATALGEAFAARFPAAYADCQAAGIDPAREKFPVTPVAHYHMGGVRVDAYGRTSVEGLWACGEVSATGLHGANRLASNSLLEALVFGERVARSAAAWVESRGVDARMPATLTPPRTAVPVDLAEARAALRQIRQLMWTHVGLVRNGAGLEEALGALDDLAAKFPQNCKTHDLITLASLVTMAALRRCESRGGHFRSDFPESSEAWTSHTLFDADGMHSDASGHIERANSAAIERES